MKTLRDLVESGMAHKEILDSVVAEGEMKADKKEENIIGKLAKAVAVKKAVGEMYEMGMEYDGSEKKEETFEKFAEMASEFVKKEMGKMYETAEDPKDSKEDMNEEEEEDEKSKEEMKEKKKKMK